MCACFELQCSEGIHTSIIMRTADIPVTITRIIIQIPITTNLKTIISITTEKRKAVHAKINRELTYNIFKARGGVPLQPLRGQYNRANRRYSSNYYQNHYAEANNDQPEDQHQHHHRKAKGGCRLYFCKNS